MSVNAGGGVLNTRTDRKLRVLSGRNLLLVLEHLHWASFKNHNAAAGIRLLSARHLLPERAS
jgi:hypothetical protein